MPVNSLTVFFPAYNEEANISSTVEKAVAVLKKLSLKWEVLIINDGSTDKTGQIANQLAQKLPNVRIIHQQNQGYGIALRTGFANAQYDWIIYTDSDGQFDFSEINKFIEQAETADAVWGYRIERSDPFYRKLFAKGWAFSIYLFFGVMLKDIDCGFKLINKEVLEKIGPLESKRGAMINAELAIKIQEAGFKIAQVGVNHYPRKSGQSTGASLKVVGRSYLDLIKLWWSMK